MRAYRCDRCGKFFVHSCRKVDKIFITDSYGGDALSKIKDLCADCQNELEAWWTIPKKEKEEVNNESR